jgi:hypothetical protein
MLPSEADERENTVGQGRGAGSSVWFGMFGFGVLSLFRFSDLDFGCCRAQRGRGWELGADT